MDIGKTSEVYSTARRAAHTARREGRRLKHEKGLISEMWMGRTGRGGEGREDTRTTRWPYRCHSSRTFGEDSLPPTLRSLLDVLRRLRCGCLSQHACTHAGTQLGSPTRARARGGRERAPAGRPSPASLGPVSISANQGPSLQPLQAKSFVSPPFSNGNTS